MIKSCFCSLRGFFILAILTTGFLVSAQTPPPTPPIAEKVLVPSAVQAVDGLQKVPANPTLDAVLAALNSPLYRMLDDLTLNRTDEHFGDGFYRYMDPTGRFLLPPALQPAEAVVFGADMEGQLVNAILAGNAVAAQSALTSYVTFMSTAVPQSATEMAANLPNYVQDMLQRVAKIVYEQTVFVPDMKNYVKDTTLGADSLAARLQLHLVADDITGVSDGSAVPRWPDRSGKNMAVVAPGGQEPTFVGVGLNGRPAVRFDKSKNQCFDVDLPLQVNNPSYTIYVVYKSNNPGDGTVDTLIGSLNNPGDALFRLLFVHREGTWVNPRVRSQPFPLVDVVSGSEIPAGDWNMATLAFDTPNSLFNIYRNGEPDASHQLAGESVSGTDNPVNPGDIPFTGRIRIGGMKLVNEGLNGEIAEVRIYEGTLSPTERDRVAEEINSRYDLGIETKRTLLSDNFNIGNTNQINTGLNLRQTGVLSPIPYTGNNLAREVKNGEALFSFAQYYNRDSWAQTSPNIDFKVLEQNDSFRIRVSVTQITGPTPIGNVTGITTETAGQPYVEPPIIFEGSWAGIRFRSPNPNSFMAAGGEGIGILLYPSGSLQVFQGDKFISVWTIHAAKTHHLDIVVKENKLSVYVNGALPTPGNPAINFPISIPAGTANFVTLQGYGTHNKETLGASFDGFDFSVVPQDTQRETFSILEDNFDATDGSGINANLDARQSGERATKKYLLEMRGVEDSKAEIRGNRLYQLPNNDLDFAQVLMTPDIDLFTVEGPKGFRIQLDVSPGKGAGDRWAGIKFRSSEPLMSVEQGDGFGLLVRENGALELFDGDLSVLSRNMPAADVYSLDLLVQNNRFSGTINGNPILFGNSLSYPIGVGSAHYITLSSFAARGIPVATTFDNLKISSLEALLPEVSLNIEVLSGNRFMISWPQIPSTGVLEFRDEFSDFTLWSDLDGQPVLVNGRYQLIDPNQERASQKFYRLRVK